MVTPQFEISVGYNLCQNCENEGVWAGVWGADGGVIISYKQI